jgi:subtilase family serine protease
VVFLLLVVFIASFSVALSLKNAATLPASFSSVNPASVVEWTAEPLFRVKPGTASLPIGLSPAQVRKAYNLPTSGGFGTIAIIDAFDNPNVLNDFVVFSNQFGLPTNSLEVHKMGSTIRVDASWALEISLDVQWAHAIAPNANILLVEAKSANLADLLGAVSYAVSRSDVVAVSMSWGDAEFAQELNFDSYFLSSLGAAFFAASGDNGSGVMWPSSSPNVIGVGGTTLYLNADGSVASEIVWSGSGGGISTYESEPSYQAAYGISGVNGKRAVPDASYNADPASGVPVYDTVSYQGQTGWFTVGGTSAGTPQWAAIHSLGLSVSNDHLYQDAKARSSFYFRDITSGSNGDYSAAVGYDLVTGLGSPVTWNYNRTLNVSVGTDRNNYFKWSYVKVNVNVADGASLLSVQGATVNASIFDPHGRVIWNKTGMTDALGGAQLVYLLTFNAQMGTYYVVVDVTIGSYRPETEQTSFFSLG